MEKEYWPTHTEKDASLMVKLTLSQLINTVLVIVVVNFKVEDWYRENGLVSDIATVTFGTSFGPQLLTAIGFNQLIAWGVLQLKLQNFDPDKPGTKTQEKLNKDFEHPAVDLPKRYATVIKIFILGLNSVFILNLR